jgi:tellurite resistance protein TerC
MLEIGLVGWAATIGLIGILLTMDLVVAHARRHAAGFREAVVWALFYSAVAVVFGVVFAAQTASQFGTQYFAALIVEKSLSVDNLFVFVVIVEAFAVPKEHQHEVLTFGIVVALVARATFIALGAALIDAFSFAFLVFGVLLIFTGAQLYRHRNEDPDVNDNALIRLIRRFMPVTTEYDNGALITRRDGHRFLTPLFLVVAAIGSTDIVFALDSIPAVFGVTDEPYIVFTATAFSLLGLRALFFLVRGLLDRLVYLSAGLAVILVFVGVKLTLHWGHTLAGGIPDVSTVVALVVIVGVLAVTTIASVITARRDHTARARAGSIRGRPREKRPPE